MNLTLASHHTRLTRVGLSAKLTSRLFNLLLKKINCNTHINFCKPTSLEK